LALVRSIVTALLLLAPAGAWAQAAEKLKVVASFSIVADFVRNVGGERIDLVTLVGPDGDAHVYSPTPADGQRVAEAKVVVVNGLGFEGWINRLVKASGTKAAVVEAARGATPVQNAASREHGRDSGDPHAWQDIGNARTYVVTIRDGLTAADPAGREIYAANAAAYLGRLDALEAEVRAAVARIPADRRRVITSHEAFSYFERAYGIDFVAPQGVSTDAEASAKDVARIIRQVRQERIGALFVENISDPRLVRRIAEETGATIGERLYSDALSGPAGPAATYIDMMRHNIRALSAALSG
jgi:zinc/manganese transport system substrate-binding protein